MRPGHRAGRPGWGAPRKSTAGIPACARPSRQALALGSARRLTARPRPPTQGRGRRVVGLGVAGGLRVDLALGLLVDVLGDVGIVVGLGAGSAGGGGHVLGGRELEHLVVGQQQLHGPAALAVEQLVDAAERAILAPRFAHPGRFKARDRARPPGIVVPRLRPPTWPEASAGKRASDVRRSSRWTRLGS